jgi:hypothetical protein
MIFRKRSFMGGAVTLAALLAMGLLATGHLRGMEILEDFEDCNYKDGNPLYWLEDPTCLAGSSRCEDGRLILSDPINSWAGTVPDMSFPGNTAIEVQATSIGDGILGLFLHGRICGFCYAVQVGYGTGSFWKPGDVQIFRTVEGYGTVLASTVLVPPPLPGEDLIIRLDYRDGMLELRIWSPGGKMPAEPLLQAQPLPLDYDLSGIYCGPAGAEGSFEYVKFIQPTPFRRGDSNADGDTDISDAIAALTDLFSGPQKVRCMSAADSNDDGEVDISDAVFLLSFLFLGEEAPKSPYLDCGVDERIDALDCREYPPCQ